MPSTPKYRTGFELKWFGTKFYYSGINRSKAEYAWGRIYDLREIQGSQKIASRMGVGLATAAKLRRLFHALDLIDDYPGHYAPGDPASSYPASIVIKDDCEWSGCTGHTGHYASLAFGDHLGDFDPYILNQTNPLSRSAENRRSVPSMFVPRRHFRLSNLSNSHETETVSSSSYLYDQNDDNLMGPPADDHLPMEEVFSAVSEVILIPWTEDDHRRRVANFMPGENFTVAEVVVTTGLSQPQAYRKVKEWIERGEAKKVKHGLYEAVDPTVATRAKLADLKARLGY